MQLFVDLESEKQNRLWLASKPTFEAMVVEIKRVKGIHGDAPVPYSEWSEVRRLTSLLPQGVATGDLQDAFAVANGRIPIDEIYPPNLVKSIEAYD